MASATCYTGSTETCETTYTYDIMGRKTSESVSHSGGTAQTTAYSYDMEGNLTELTYPGAAQGVSSLTYSYDTQNRLTEIRNDSTIMRAISYDSFGRESTVTDRLSGTDSITTSYTYDNAGRLTTSTAKNESNDQIEKLTYTYSGTKITQRREQSSLPGITALDETRTYIYDALGRLTNSTAGASNAQYTYDAAGNQTTEDTDDIYRARYYDGLNQLTWEDVSDYVLYEDRSITYVSDGRGNMTSALDTDDTSGMMYYYNADGTMSGMSHRPGRGTGGWSLTQTMKYDHNGIRSEKTVDGAKTDYYYAEGKPIIFTSTSHTETNIFNGKEIIGAYHGSTWYDYLTDQQGSIMGILKQDGTTTAAYKYSDYGETEARYGSTFGNETCYTGAVYDSDYGEYYLNARYYDPTTANFLSQDTYRGDNGDYGQWNLYAYCANDPIDRADPTGHKYRPELAAQYGIDWGCSRNPKYYDFGEHADCTNFVSQCVEHGGKKQKVDPNYIIYPKLVKITTKYWYSVRGESGGPNNPEPSYFWKISSSWSAVNDFFTYWKNHGAKKTNKTYRSIKKLSKHLKLGDIIQLHTDGEWKHSIIISRKDKGKWAYAGHSYDHKYKPITKIKGYDKFRIIRIH